MLDHQFGIMFLTEIAIQLFSLQGCHFGIAILAVRLYNVLKYRYGHLYFLFFIMGCFSTCRNYVVQLFNIVTLFDEIKISLYFVMLKLTTEITLTNGHFSFKLVLVISSLLIADLFFLNLIFRNFTDSFDEINALFYNELFHLFGFHQQNNKDTANNQKISK